MMLNEHEDVVDVDVDLLDELHFEDEVVRDRFLIHLRALVRLVIEVQVDASVVFELARGDRVIALEVVEGREDVAQAQDLPMRSMKRFCSFSEAIDPMGSGKSMRSCSMISR